jgi:PmbA protein
MKTKPKQEPRPKALPKPQSKPRSKPRPRDTGDAEALVRWVLDQALAAGAEAAEGYFEHARRTTIRVQDGQVENQVQADEAGIGLRVLLDHRMGFSSTTRLEPDELGGFVEEAIELARLATPDESAMLPTGGPAGGAALVSLDLVDSALRDATTGDKTALLARNEAAARAPDPRLRTDFFIYDDQLSLVHLASTHGVRVTYEAGHYAMTGAALTLTDGTGGGTESGGFRAGRRFGDLEEPRFGRLLAERALRTVGGRPLPPGTMTVVFPPDFAAEILSGLAMALEGPNVIKGDSFLAGRLGERIGSDLWNVIDDGTLPGGLGTAPADGEGVPCEYHHPIVAGRLTSFLHDSYSAARMNILSTGNAHRDSFRCLPRVGHRNLILTPGHRTPEEILATIDHGLYVHQTTHTGGIDPVTGLYSVAAAGQLIERGRLGRPVAHVTVASSLQEMLRNLVAVAHDLEWCGAVATPTLAIDKMTVAGEG